MPDEWLIHLVRLTAFSTETISPSERYWTVATGQAEAENRTSAMGARQYTSHLYGGIVQLAFAGNRVDLLLAADPEIPITDLLPAVGPADALLPEFSAMARQFLAEFDLPINRIAFGGQYFLQAASRDASYEKIATLAKSITVDGRRARELQFRINWPVDSKIVPGMFFNRLTSFSTLLFGRMMVHGQPSHVTIIPAASDGMLCATSLELDHNSPGERVSAFEKTQLLPIFDELLHLTMENLAAGEIK